MASTTPPTPRTATAAQDDESMLRGTAPETRLAYEAFAKLERLRIAQAKAERTLGIYAKQVPPKDMNAYVEATEKLRRETDAKVAKWEA